MRSTLPTVALLAAAFSLGVASLGLGEASPLAATQPAFAPLGEPSLHNGHRVSDKVLSGAQPEGEASFKALSDLGVKTIISVDGAKPDVELARKYGLRYIHIPISYSDVQPHDGKAIAKAIREIPGRVYIHCHHGKHRSAAATAVACVYAGEIKPEQAEDVLRTFGTGSNYKGLWQAARDARPLEPGVLEGFRVDYVERAEIGDMADAMVRIDRHWDHLKQIRDAGWKVPADHPDLDPPHEALLVMEHFHEIGRAESAKGLQPEFKKHLAASEAGAKDLRDALAAKPVNAGAAAAAFKTVAQSCTDCHRVYRDE